MGGIGQDPLVFWAKVCDTRTIKSGETQNETNTKEFSLFLETYSHWENGSKAGDYYFGKPNRNPSPQHQ